MITEAINMIKKVIILFIFTVSFLTFVSSTFASTLYLSPGSANIPQDTTLSVNVGINTENESVNGVSIYLSYPLDLLEVEWISYGSKFDIAAEGTYGEGSIRISRGSVSGVVGNVPIATIGFRGKSQGTATVAFVTGSAAASSSDSSDSLNLPGSNAGVYTVVAPKLTTATPVEEQGQAYYISLLTSVLVVGIIIIGVAFFLLRKKRNGETKI